MVVVVLLIYYALEAMVRSPWGRVLKAIREDEAAASSLGKSPFRFRLQSFVIGSAIMGLGGALNASFIGFIAPTDFLPILTFEIWAMLIVGGSGNNRGAILGSVLVWALWTGTGSLTQAVLPSGLQVKGGAVQIILIGLVLMVMLVLRPRGLIGEEAVVSREAELGGEGRG
jgi:branched-chain amino acid transport system permease protein